MRALIQRVSHASVTVEGERVGEIEKGLLVLLGVGPQDTEKQADFLAEKCANLRIFTDENDKMNLSLLDIGGEMLVVSQFTLYADCRKGRRPSFVGAASPAEADRLYEYFQQKVREIGVSKVGHGKFGASMQVELLNNGPVTIMLDTDDTYYTSDYYISAEDYNAILAQYYSTSEVSGWEHGTYNGVDYWYDRNYYGSAYAAYTAGQEAVAHWVHDTTTGN